MPKKLLSLTLALLLLLGICLPAASVSAASSPTLSQTMLAIRPGESATLTVNLNGSGATVSSWSSSNPSVATVSNGRVQGVSYGISAVTAYFSNGTYATCQVHVALQGIDVSYYQGNINWNAVASSGNVDFAIIRTGYGGENWAEQVDTCFEQNYAGATSNNIPVGVYHFSYATDVEMAKREAQFCLSILDGRPLDYPVFYDIETAQHRNMSSSELAAIVTAFCDIIEAAGYTPAIYSSPTFFNGSLSSPLLDKYDHWVAHYGVDRPNYTKPFVMWQNGFRSVSGISGNVDANYCYKDYTTGGSGGNVGTGGDGSYTLSCSVSSYTFGSNSTYDFTVYTKNPSIPTASSSSPDVVSVGLYRIQDGSYVYRLRKGSNPGVALIVIQDDVGNTLNFWVTVKEDNSSSSNMSCSILSYTFPSGTNSYVFDVTVSGSTAPSISSSNTSVVEARYYSATTTGFRYELVNKGAGTATVTLRSQSGQTISIPVTGRALSTGGNTGGNSSGGNTSSGALPCDTSSYTFTTLNAYTYKVTTNSATPPTATSSNPSAVSVAYKGPCDGGYLFTITNQGAGTATITTKDADGRTCSFTATGKATSSGGNTSSGTLPCDTSSYTFTTLNAYTYKVTTNSATPPTATSSNPSAVSVAYKGACEGGYLFTITNQGAGTATITTKDADGRTCSFTATGKATSSGGNTSSGTLPCDTSSYTFTTLNAYTYKVTTNSTTPPTATSSNPSAVSVAYKGACEGGYLFTITNQGAGTATITTKDADGRTCSFTATGKATSSGGNTSSGTLPCDTSSYTFTTLNAYTYKVTTNSTTPPTATSSNPSAVSVAYKGACEGGYLFTITNQGAGTATITTKDADGRTCSFTATGKATSSGSSYSIKSDTTSQFSLRVGSTYTFKFTVTGGGSPQFASGNTSFLQLVNTVKEGNDYLVTFRGVSAGQVGVYASADGPSMSRQCIIDVV